MRYDPTLVVYHDRRSDLSGFVRQLYKYGYGRGQIIGGHPSTTRIPYVVPSLLVLYAGALPVMASLSPLALAPAGFYLLSLIANGLKVSATMGRLSVLPLASFLTMVIHGGYGVGVLRGIFSPSKQIVRSPPQTQERSGSPRRDVDTVR